MTDTETKLADALRLAREYVAELLTEREAMFAGYGSMDEIRTVRETLAEVDEALAAHDAARAQPASESKPIGFILRDVNEPRDYYPDTFVLDEPQEDETDEQHWEPVYAEATPAQPASVADLHEFGDGVHNCPKAAAWEARARFWREKAIALGYPAANESDAAPQPSAQESDR